MKCHPEAPDHNGTLRASTPALNPSIGRPSTRIVTTSWDDGDPFDGDVAKLLADRKLPGTFYIPIQGHHSAVRMDRTDMLSLDAQGFEIGAHGVSHKNLTRCDSRQLVIEVEGCKKRLEDEMGKKIPMFAYPGGRHNRSVIAAVKRAGFTGARTTEMLARGMNFAPFSMPTSVHVYPHSRIDYLRNLLRAGDLGRGRDYLIRFWHAEDWVSLAKMFFDTVLRNGGVWHLYGHSWEIQELRLWDGLKEVLDYVSNRPGVLYLANGRIVNPQVIPCTSSEICPAPATAPPQSQPGVQEPRERQVGICQAR